jgi:hypothetical protein
MLLAANILARISGFPVQTNADDGGSKPGDSNSETREMLRFVSTRFAYP